MNYCTEFHIVCPKSSKISTDVAQSPHQNDIALDGLHDAVGDRLMAGLLQHIKLLHVHLLLGLDDSWRVDAVELRLDERDLRRGRRAMRVPRGTPWSSANTMSLEPFPRLAFPDVGAPFLRARTCHR